jgi:alkylation response protein AidB-like acyl-CoA dehydrogenase
VKRHSDCHDRTGTGSDLQAVRTSAVLDGDEYVINGSKILSPMAIYAIWQLWCVKLEIMKRFSQFILNHR